MSDTGNAVRFNNDAVYHLDVWAELSGNASPGDWIKVVILTTGASNKSVCTYEGEVLGASACCTAGFAENWNTMYAVETSDDLPYTVSIGVFEVGPWVPPQCT